MLPRHIAILVGCILVVCVARASAQSADALINGGFERQSGSANQARVQARNQARAWQPFHGGYTRGEFGRSGYGIRVHNSDPSGFAGASQRIDLRQNTMEPVSVGGYVRGVDIDDRAGRFGASLYAEIHMTDGSVAYWNTERNHDTFQWRWIGFNTASLREVDKPIDHIFVVVMIGLATGTAYFDDISVVSHPPGGGAVSLVFDDGVKDTYTRAKPVLDRYGYRATVAVISDRIGDDGFLTLDQVKGLADSGWEVASHGRRHLDLTKLSSERLRRELRLSRQRLRGYGFAVKNLVLPFGAYNAEVVARARRVYRSVRAYELGDNPRGTFPFAVRVRSVVETTTVDEFNRWLERARDEGRWQVITFHAISATGDDAYHVDPDTFTAMVAALEASGVDTITYDEGIGRFGVRPRTARVAAWNHSPGQ